MSFTSKASLVAYRTALALNNMAITLMKKECDELALKTFSDSLSLMKVAFYKKSETPVNANETLKTAYKRCTHALNMHESSNANEADIHVLDDDDFHALRSAVTYGPTSSVAFFVRISESLPCDAECDSSELAQQLGIIVYNYGVSSFLVSRRRMEGKNGKYLQKASKSLKMADSTFTSVIEMQSEDVQMTSAAVLLLALALNCIAVVLSRQRMLFKAKEAQYAVSVLCSSVEENCYASSMLVQQSAPAA
ncbi:hypothetical protein ACA910_015863 [Epithemia clementina (nom. ined.)]